MIDLPALASRLPAAPRTRYAPSPTGLLHLGHVANAVWVWGLARAAAGRVVLRIEDHDRTRCRPEFERAIVEDLAWLGLRADAGLGADDPLGDAAYRQSDCTPAYEAALDRLRAAGLVYACRCSRREIAAVAGAVANEETPYPGTCRDLGLVEGDGVGLRLRLEPGEERFDDAVLGPQRQEPARQSGDLLLRDRLGYWTYQFAVVVDDMRHDIDLVVRGEDLLLSTGRQLRLARLLGREKPPVFAHHPLIVNASGEKLSKSAHDTGIRELRAAGADPGELLREAAARSGWPGPVPG